MLKALSLQTLKHLSVYRSRVFYIRSSYCTGQCYSIINYMAACRSDHLHISTFALITIILRSSFLESMKVYRPRNSQFYMALFNSHVYPL